MKPETTMRFTDDQRAAIDRIAASALALPHDQRSAFVATECADDAAVRAEVLSLLAEVARSDAVTFMNSPAILPPADPSAGSPQAVDSAANTAPRQIGPYTLLRLIGEGGFGSVFMAEQREPVQRTVALKILKLGMDTKQVIARFEQERQALALMDHPHIATVLDAGATESGRPYFVMELVSGTPITEYCDTHHLTIEQRLTLLVQVCQAVQHAHAKGIIHRDIKPSNVLVTTHDGRPHAKVIDFGIVKATAMRLTEATLFTENRQLIGTPLYMSPEQAEGSPDIDTRTDVYSLGVLLYELLTGVTPFNAGSLRAAALSEVQRIIREVEPAKPSTRLSAETESLARVAACRRAEPRKLTAAVRGDLDWIVMKALEKDRARRYETANGLAMDILRYLGGEAVVAAPPSRVYRIQKFARRHRGAVVAASLVAAALVLGIVGTSIGLVRAEQQRTLAEAARAAETTQRRHAEVERDKARIIAEFMRDTLLGVGVSVALGRDTKMLREMMDKAAARIEAGGIRATPEAERALRRTIADVYIDLAEFPSAGKMLTPIASQPASPGSASGDALERALIQRSWAYYQKGLGDAKQADALFAESTETLRSAGAADGRELVRSLTAHGELLLDLGRYADAEEASVEALEMCQRLSSADSEERVDAMQHLATAREFMGRPQEAEPLLEQAMEICGRLFPGDHPQTGAVLFNLARVRGVLGRMAAAEPLFRRSLEMCQRIYPKDHPVVASGWSGLGYALVNLGRYQEAVDALRAGIDMTDRLGTTNDANSAAGLTSLAAAYLYLNRPADALPAYDRATAIMQKITSDDHPNVAALIGNSGRAYELMQNYPESEGRYRRALEMWRRLYPGDHQGVAANLCNLARLCVTQNKFAEAAELNREALAMYRRLNNADSRELAITLFSLARCNHQLSRPAEAEPLFVEALAMAARLWPDGHADRAKLARWWPDFLQAQGRHKEARAAADEISAMIGRFLPADNEERKIVEAAMLKIAASQPASQPQS